MIKKALLVFAVCQTVACGTALYHHAIRVSTVNAAETDIGIFDHQQGYSRDWAHRTLRKSSASTVYTTTLETTAAVSLASAHDPHPFEVALAIPEVTDEGYFLLTIDTPGEHVTKRAAFCHYDEYFPPAGARTIPVVVTASSVKGDWHIELAVDIAAAKQAIAP